ncbi:MAG: hypothetical protein LBR53_05810 [Deltaproteobacteria bacterium]|jgi:hypothetical protein|nr:hypothetical protein [Deltaproteobacteria bacterium]
MKNFRSFGRSLEVDMTSSRRPWLFVLLSLVSGFLGAFLFSLTADPAVNALRAQEETVRGDPRQTLIAGELRLADEQGRSRLVIALVLGKPRILMLDEQGQYRLELGLGNSGEPRVWLRDQDGASKAQVALTPQGIPSFTLADQKGRDRAILALTKGGEPTFVLKDQNGADRVAVWRGERDEGVALADGSGKAIAYLSVEDGGIPALSY